MDLVVWGEDWQGGSAYEEGEEKSGEEPFQGARGGSIYQKGWESTIAIGEYHQTEAVAHLAMLTTDPRRDEGRSSKYLELTFGLFLPLFSGVSPLRKLTSSQSAPEPASVIHPCWLPNRTSWSRVPSGSVGTFSNQSLNMHSIHLKKIYISLLLKITMCLYYPVSHLLPREASWIYSLALSFEFAFIPLPFPLVSTHSHPHLKEAPPRLITKLLLDICTISVLIYLTTFSAFDHNNDGSFPWTSSSVVFLFSYVLSLWFL